MRPSQLPPSAGPLIIAGRAPPTGPWNTNNLPNAHLKTALTQPLYAGVARYFNRTAGPLQLVLAYLDYLGIGMDGFLDRWIHSRLRVSIN